MATIIEIITAIVMLTPEDANLLKTTHPAPIQKTFIDYKQPKETSLLEERNFV